MAEWSFILRSLRPHRRRIIIAALALLTVTALSLAPPLILAFVIDQVIGRGRYHWLAPVMIIALSIPMIDAVLRTVSNYLVTLIGQRVVLDIRLALYRRVQRLSYRYMQNTTTGKLMERLRGDVGQINMLLTNQVLTLSVQLACALVAVGIMAFISVRLTILTLAAIGLYVANYRWFVRRIRAAQRRYRRKMDLLSSMAQERLAGTIVVKAFGSERREARDFNRQNFLAERCFHRFRMFNVWYGLSSSAITWLTYLSVMFFGSYLAVRGSLTYGAVTAVGAYTWRLLTPAVALSELSNQIEQAKVSLARIFELLRAEPDAVELPGVRPTRLRGEVAFENVCFDYEAGKPLLRHVNLYVRPGQTVALVGPTGCGKSTIFNLLYRYYEPIAGHLTIDGHEISTLDTSWYRGHLALVPQDPVVFDTTIAHNIAYGCPNADDEAIERVARLAELGDLLDSLPEGIHARLGEYGIKLSVGERQRICIARAILADPVILLLDEATSSLDPDSEALIQLALGRLMEGRTSFVIAHRLHTIVHADVIVVFDRGRIIEMGNHAQLMRRANGFYRDLYMTQTAGSEQTAAAFAEAVTA